MGFKKKNQKKNQKNQKKIIKQKFLSSILRISQRILIMTCLKIILKSQVSVPSIPVKNLYEIKNKNKNNDLVNVIKSGLKDLKEEIKEMSKEERKIEKPDKIVEIVEEINEQQFNEQQEGKGLKILTPYQKLSRLPISLAQLQAGNNSQKLKNEIRQILYSLYRSKNMTKQVYNNLIKYIHVLNDN